jgi:hypothetical protein
MVILAQLLGPATLRKYLDLNVNMSTPTVMNTLTTTTSEEHAVLITKGVTEPKSVVRLDPVESKPKLSR